MYNNKLLGRARRIVLLCGDNVDHRKANVKEDIKEAEYDVNEMGNDEHLPLYVAISKPSLLENMSPSITAPLSDCYYIPWLTVCS